ncbi:hypothetical protein F511_46399 [Dorcoceras hygrometricum]|uniref:Uncharacterized protein n=1 Tax=Dorcoceras hygrometricum TaxID=472368 RepID=A0A2Z6ZTN0_9LAMI|nr:hypothetical protein F511_46399 [Dorcoceras hygrometricum]
MSRVLAESSGRLAVLICALVALMAAESCPPASRMEADHLLVGCRTMAHDDRPLDARCCALDEGGCARPGRATHSQRAAECRTRNSGGGRRRAAVVRRRSLVDCCDG